MEQKRVESSQLWFKCRGSNRLNQAIGKNPDRALIVWVPRKWSLTMTFKSYMPKFMYEDPEGGSLGEDDGSF